MSKLECVLTDVCLPDYFSGDYRPWVTVPVFKGMTLKEIKIRLHSEINQDAVGGNAQIWDMSQKESDRWYRRTHAAINRIKPAKKGQRKFFNDLEESSQNEFDDTTVQAFFVFIVADD